jgi:hypothetical protein
MTRLEELYGRECNEKVVRAIDFHWAVDGDAEYEVCPGCGEDPKDCICELRYCGSCGDELHEGRCIRCQAEDYNRWYTKQNGFHGVNEYVNQERSRQSWGIGAGHYDGLD